MSLFNLNKKSNSKILEATMATNDDKHTKNVKCKIYNL